MDHPADLINVAIEDLVRQRMAKRANLHQYISIYSAMRGCGKSFALRGACQLPKTGWLVTAAAGLPQRQRRRSPRGNAQRGTVSRSGFSVAVSRPRTRARLDRRR